MRRVERPSVGLFFEAAATACRHRSPRILSTSTECQCRSACLSPSGFPPLPQIDATLAFPQRLKTIFWSVFAPNRLPDIAISLRRLSLTAPPQAVSLAIYILSLIPDPKEEPYFGKFLRNSRWWRICERRLEAPGMEDSDRKPSRHIGSNPGECRPHRVQARSSQK
ncbi:hypothetical protein K438DRAFT_704403 [Mycena galopus ATCC 62051]|nr:hypothetical protein K438DRAFT_704403 [Mycena galopus ATCC 62051]